MNEYLEREELAIEFMYADADVVEDYGDGECEWGFSRKKIQEVINSVPSADVAPVRHGRCPVCSGNAVLTQDCDNGYSLEVDAEHQETSLWYGDECLAVFHIDYCPSCGAKMEGDENA